jgi:predicted phage terminase large subunit-like protein
MMLMMSDPVTRARMMAGDWDVLVEGTRFRREWFEWVDQPPPSPRAVVRHWDLAATEPSPGAPDPDYTVGTRLHLYADGSYCVADVRRVRISSAKVEETVAQAAHEDGRAVKIGIEQEPGASGKSLLSHFQRNVLRGFVCEGVRPTGDKFTRAGPAAAAAEQKRVVVQRAPWNQAWLAELCLFTEGYKGHDDQVDSFSGAFELVHRAARPTGRRARGTLPSSFARAGGT